MQLKLTYHRCRLGNKLQACMLTPDICKYIKNAYSDGLAEIMPVCFHVTETDASSTNRFLSVQKLALKLCGPHFEKAAVHSPIIPGAYIVLNSKGQLLIAQKQELIEIVQDTALPESTGSNELMGYRVEARKIPGRALLGSPVVCADGCTVGNDWTVLKALDIPQVVQERNKLLVLHNLLPYEAAMCMAWGLISQTHTVECRLVQYKLVVKHTLTLQGPCADRECNISWRPRA